MVTSGRRQAIIWINDGILLMDPLGTKCNGNSYTFIQESAFENVVCKNGGHFFLASMC